MKQRRGGIENKRQPQMGDADFAVSASSPLHRCPLSLAGQQLGYAELARLTVTFAEFTKTA